MTETASSAHPSPREEKQTTAVFMPKTDENGRVLSNDQQRNSKVTVHFNPESLDITFTNSIQAGRRNQPAQVSVTETTAKLSMELVFDTTLTGIDVRTETNKLARLMNPAHQTPRRPNTSGKIPSIVIFQWGTIWFEGYIDTYRERIDFFSSEGVPLRAAVTLSMTQQQRDFQPNTSVAYNNNVTGGSLSLGSNAAINRNNTPVNRIGSNKSVTDAVKAGNPSAGGSSAAARSVAAANGIENIRLPEVNEIVISDFQLPKTPRFGLSFTASGGGESLKVKGGTENLFSNLKETVDSSIGSLGGGLSLDMESHFNMGLNDSKDMGGSASMSADVGVSADIELGIKFEE